MHFEEQVKNMKHKTNMKELAWTYLLEYRDPTFESIKEKQKM